MSITVEITQEQIDASGRSIQDCPLVGAIKTTLDTDKVLVGKYVYRVNDFIAPLSEEAIRWIEKYDRWKAVQENPSDTTWIYALTAIKPEPITLTLEEPTLETSLAVSTKGNEVFIDLLNQVSTTLFQGYLLASDLFNAFVADFTKVVEAENESRNVKE